MTDRLISNYQGDRWITARYRRGKSPRFYYSDGRRHNVWRWRVGGLHSSLRLVDSAMQMLYERGVHDER